MPAAANPLSAQVEIVREPSRVLVRVRTPLAARIAYAVFIGCYLLGTLAGVVAVASMLGSDRLEQRAATAAGMWLVALLAGVGFGAWALFRTVLATEVVEVGRDTFAVRHVAGPIRTGTSYPLAGVRNLRHEELPRRRRGGRRTAFAFDHAGGTVRFGYGVDGPPAGEALAALRQRLGFPGGSAPPAPTGEAGSGLHPGSSRRDHPKN